MDKRYASRQGNNKMVQFVVMGLGAIVKAVAFFCANSLFSMSSEAERQKEADAREKFQEDLTAWN